jgi:hypothetical protein
MAEEVDASSKGADLKDARADWIRDRVCSSLKVRPEQFAKLSQGDAK